MFRKHLCSDEWQKLRQGNILKALTGRHSEPGPTVLILVVNEHLFSENKKAVTSQTEQRSPRLP